MRVHHFYPKTRNVGDHFVQRGIERMIREIEPRATFESFNVNSRGEDRVGYGLTRATVARANREADLVVVGGSNLYEGSWRWPWGVHLEPDALGDLRAPLFLIGIGTGSGFLSPAHRPSPRALREIKLLNGRAAFSGVRDALTLDWLRALGVLNAELTGDPATFIFNEAPRPAGAGGPILIVVPPSRFWGGAGRFWLVRPHGRSMFRALARLALALADGGQEIVAACNDPADLQLARRLFDGPSRGRVVCPRSPEEYFRLLSDSRAVVTGRLHSAVVAFSLGLPFVALDADQRTRGFIETYGLDEWAVEPSSDDFESRLRERVGALIDGGDADSWRQLVGRRDAMRARAVGLMRDALGRVGG